MGMTYEEIIKSGCRHLHLPEAIGSHVFLTKLATECTTEVLSSNNRKTHYIIKKLVNCKTDRVHIIHFRHRFDNIYTLSINENSRNDSDLYIHQFLIPLENLKLQNLKSDYDYYNYKDRQHDEDLVFPIILENLNIFYNKIKIHFALKDEKSEDKLEKKFDRESILEKGIADLKLCLQNELTNYDRIFNRSDDINVRYFYLSIKNMIYVLDKLLRGEEIFKDK